MSFRVNEEVLVFSHVICWTWPDLALESGGCIRCEFLELLPFFVMSSFIDQYEPLDIIGNGSFGIIRKVRRKVDDVVRSPDQWWKLQIQDRSIQVFARKELNFQRMSERDRKQIVAEV